SYGIDVKLLETAVAAERVRASFISEPLVAALNEWLMFIPRREARRRDAVRAIADMSDPDPWRGPLRHPHTPQNQPAPHTIDRHALEELAGRPEVAAQPPSTIAMLGRSLEVVGADSKAVEIMCAAQRRHPADFWLNIELSAYFRWKATPQRFDEAAGYARAALAGRPNDPAVHAALGACLLTPDHVDEAI